MPSRIIREEILSSGRVDCLDWQQEVFYRRLLSKVDDHGLYDARPSLLRATLFPLRVDKVSEDDCSNWLVACEAARLIVTYEVNGKPFLKVLDTRWQTRSEPKYPLPDVGLGIAKSATVNNCLQPLTTAPVVVVVDVVEVVDESVVDKEQGVASAPPAKPVAATSTHGTRLDPLWVLPQPWAEWALAERRDWTIGDVERVGLQFRDHWHGMAGAKARKADWLATWRNWVRNERRNYRTRPDQPPSVSERRGSSIGLIGKGNDGRVITGTAERVDQSPIRAIAVDLREQGRCDVRLDGNGPVGSRAADGGLDRDVGNGTGPV